MPNEISLYIMATLYIVAGINHFINPRWYLKIMPPWLPYHQALNYISGACEILFGALLFPEQTRSLAAWLIIGLLVAVFPANVQMSIHYSKRKNLAFWLSIARLPIQLVLIYWAWSCT